MPWASVTAIVWFARLQNATCCNTCVSNATFATQTWVSHAYAAASKPMRRARSQCMCPTQHFATHVSHAAFHDPCVGHATFRDPCVTHTAFSGQCVSHAVFNDPCVAHTASRDQCVCSTQHCATYVCPTQRLATNVCRTQRFTTNVGRSHAAFLD